MNKPPENINKLPNDILIEIFKFLSIEELTKAIGSVCRSWRKLSKNQSLWQIWLAKDYGLTPDLLNPKVEDQEKRNFEAYKAIFQKIKTDSILQIRLLGGDRRAILTISNVLIPGTTHNMMVPVGIDFLSNKYKGFNIRLWDLPRRQGRLNAITGTSYHFVLICPRDKENLINTMHEWRTDYLNSRAKLFCLLSKDHAQFNEMKESAQTLNIIELPKSLSNLLDIEEEQMVQSVFKELCRIRILELLDENKENVSTPALDSSSSPNDTNKCLIS